MNDAPTIIISLIIGILLGGAGMYFTSEYLEQKEFKVVVSSNPSVIFDECENLPNELQANCANGVLLRKAVQQNDANLCQSITVVSQKESCLTTLSYLDTFETESQAYCGQAQNRALCLDLLQVLAVDAKQDTSLCSQISSDGLRTECASRVPVGSEQQAFAQQTPELHYGPICPPGENQECEVKAELVHQAVLSGDLTNCVEAAEFMDVCLQEVELYQLFLTNGVEGCEGLPERPPVRSEPGSLESILTFEACQTELAIGADRFDYLN